MKLKYGFDTSIKTEIRLKTLKDRRIKTEWTRISLRELADYSIKRGKKKLIISMVKGGRVDASFLMLNFLSS